MLESRNLNMLVFTRVFPSLEEKWVPVTSLDDSYPYYLSRKSQGVIASRQFLTIARRYSQNIASYSVELFWHACIIYVVWVLFGVITFVTHLGEDLEEVQQSWLLSAWLRYNIRWALPAGGRPAPHLAVNTWTKFFAHNLQLAAVFVGHHSLMPFWKRKRKMRQKSWRLKDFDKKFIGNNVKHVAARSERRKTTLAKVVNGLQQLLLTFLTDRKIYNVFSAVTLHYFLSNYSTYRRQEGSSDPEAVGTSMVFGWHIPSWRIPNELTLPISAELHAIFAIVIIIPCFVIFLKNRSTWVLLYGESMGQFSGNIDIITQMASSVHKEVGILGFVLFSGMSIVPRTIRIDDVVVRVVAAIYLRCRSAHFRAFSTRMSDSHEAAWGARAFMLLSVFLGSGRTSFDLSSCICTVLGGMACVCLMQIT